MHELLAWSILSIGGVFVGMTALIIANKAWRESIERYQRVRRRVLEPAVVGFAHGQTESMVTALGSTPRRRDREVLETILLDHAQRVRGSAHDRLTGALDELGYVDGYLERLSSRRWWRRAWAAEKLGLASARRAVGPLIRAMRDESPEVRMRVAKALGILGGSASVRELIRALDEPSRWSSIRIADVLTGMGREVVEELTAAFGELGATGKLAALDVIGRIRPLHSVPWLVARLRESDPDVRARACHALGSIGDPAAAAALVTALDDEAWPVRAMAAKALGKAGGPAAIPELCRAMGDPEWWVRTNAARALRGMGTPGRTALDRMLDSEDRYARHQAVLMLEEMGVVDRFAHGLVSGSGEEREQARAFVRRLIAGGQTGRLRSLADGADEPALRDALHELLGDRAVAPEGGP